MEEINEIKEKNPKTAPWLKSLETPRIYEKKKENGKHHGPKGKDNPINALNKSPQKAHDTNQPDPYPLHQHPKKLKAKRTP